MTILSNTPSGDAVNAAEPVPDAALQASESGTGEGDNGTSRLLNYTAHELLGIISAAREIWVQFTPAPNEYFQCRVTKRDALRALSRVTPFAPMRAIVSKKYKSVTICELSR